MFPNVGRASDSMMARLKAFNFSWLGSKLFIILLVSFKTLIVDTRKKRVPITYCLD